MAVDVAAAAEALSETGEASFPFASAVRASSGRVLGIPLPGHFRALTAASRPSAARLVATRLFLGLPRTPHSGMRGRVHRGHLVRDLVSPAKTVAPTFRHFCSFPPVGLHFFQTPLKFSTKPCVTHNQPLVQSAMDKLHVQEVLDLGELGWPHAESQSGRWRQQ
jgi:hypothetical protein